MPIHAHFSAGDLNLTGSWARSQHQYNLRHGARHCC